MSGILAHYEEWVSLVHLAMFLEGTRPPLSFFRKMRKDEAFRIFVEWLTALDGRREHAAKRIRYQVSHKICPNCGGEVDPAFLEPLPPIDWTIFS